MRKTVMCVVALLMLNGCTTFVPPRQLGAEVWNSDCETVDCLLAKYDEVITDNPESKGGRFKFMDGYKDTPVVYMYEQGLLTIEEISPYWLFLQIPMMAFVPAYTKVTSGPNGDMGSSEIHYMPIVGWKVFLTHELMHAQGYKEWGYGPLAWLVNMPLDRYTDNQRYMVKEEGVERWQDTTFYKNEDPIWHTVQVVENTGK